jgi:hypothetical protein
LRQTPEHHAVTAIITPGRWYLGIAIIALAIALVPLRASPEASVHEHIFWVMKWWVPSLLLLAFTLFRRWRGRGVVAIVAGLLYFSVFLAHPVCDEIPASTQANFETVISLEERARRGEPFEKLDGKWYQCKSWLARQFFF